MGSIIRVLQEFRVLVLGSTPVPKPKAPNPSPKTTYDFVGLG